MPATISSARSPRSVKSWVLGRCMGWGMSIRVRFFLAAYAIVRRRARFYAVGGRCVGAVELEGRTATTISSEGHFILEVRQ